MPPNDLDLFVMDVLAELVDSEHYHNSDPNDVRLLADCRRYLCKVGPTLSCHEIDAALLSGND
jgi:hypothetical protein